MLKSSFNCHNWSLKSQRLKISLWGRPNLTKRKILNSCAWFQQLYLHRTNSHIKKQQFLTSFSQPCVEQEKLHQVLLFQFAESLHNLPSCHYNSPWKTPQEATRQNSEQQKQQILICWEPNSGKLWFFNIIKPKFCCCEWISATNPFASSKSCKWTKTNSFNSINYYDTNLGAYWMNFSNHQMVSTFHNYNDTKLTSFSGDWREREWGIYPKKIN